MRRPDWLVELWLQVEAARDERFEYARHDCCLFVARCVDAMTESDFSARLRACYHDEATALAYLERMGGMQAAVTVHLGPPLERPAMARRGDVVMFHDGAGRETLGICTGELLATTGQGFTFQPMTLASVAWRV
jgi:hypothetical protein